MEFLQHLAQEVEKTGHAVEYTESSIFIESLNLQIEGIVNDKKEHNVNGEYSVVYELHITATHKELFPEGIWDCLAGVGENDDAAFSYAAQNWVWVNFLVIHEIIVPVETKDFNVPRFDLLTRNLDTGEEFAFKMFLGELQTAGEFMELKDSLEETVLIQKLLNAISAVAIEKKLFWIKIYIAKINDNQIMGDCLLNNQNWLEGLNVLYLFVEDLKYVKSYAALKQFIIIKPCAMSELKNPDKIRESLPPTTKPSFLRKLFGKWI